MAGLDPWYALLNDSRVPLKMVACGDSVTQGDVPPQNNGGWTEMLRNNALSRWGKGGEGLWAIYRENWVAVGTWVQATTSDVWDSHNHQTTKFANGSAKTYTWTTPASMSIDNFDLYIVDGPGSANFAYSFDGGSTWTNTAFTLIQDNQVKKQHFAHSLPVGATFKMRAANAAGTAVNVYLIGIEPRTSTPGLIVENIAHNGDLLAFSEERVTVGNKRSWFQLEQPKLVVIEYWNDTVWQTAVEFQARLLSFVNFVVGYGGCVLLHCYLELDQGSAVEATYRAAFHAVAAATGMPIIDYYQLIGDRAAAEAGGYLIPVNQHPTNLMTQFMADRVWEIISHGTVGTRFQAPV